jgi:Transposase IS66 family
MAGGYLQIDETPIRYLSPGHGQTKLGYFWTALSPGGDVIYHWETSRGADRLKNVIAAEASFRLGSKMEAESELVESWFQASLFMHALLDGENRRIFLRNPRLNILS